MFEDDADDEEEKENPDDHQSPPPSPTPPSHNPTSHPPPQETSNGGGAPKVGEEVSGLQEAAAQRDTNTRMSSVDSMDDIQRRIVVKVRRYFYLSLSLFFHSLATHTHTLCCCYRVWYSQAAEAVLSTDEETPSPTTSKPDHTSQPLPQTQTMEEGMDMWLYRDPQDEVQGIHRWPNWL